jgi:hypothetical protein
MFGLTFGMKQCVLAKLDVPSLESSASRLEINVIDSGFLLRVSMVSWQHLD